MFQQDLTNIRWTTTAIGFREFMFGLVCYFKICFLFGLCAAYCSFCLSMCSSFLQLSLPSNRQCYVSASWCTANHMSCTQPVNMSSVRRIPWQRYQCTITGPKNRRWTKESNPKAHKHQQPIAISSNVVTLVSAAASQQHPTVRLYHKEFCVVHNTATLIPCKHYDHKKRDDHKFKEWLV